MWWSRSPPRPTRTLCGPARHRTGRLLCLPRSIRPRRQRAPLRRPPATTGANAPGRPGRRGCSPPVSATRDLSICGAWFLPAALANSPTLGSPSDIGRRMPELKRHSGAVSLGVDARFGPIWRRSRGVRHWVMPTSVLFCSSVMWEKYSEQMVAASPGLEVVTYTVGERVSDDGHGSHHDRLLVGRPVPRRVCPGSSRCASRRHRWSGSRSSTSASTIRCSVMMIDKGMRLTTGSGTSAIPIAHHVIMCLLALARDLPGSLARQQRHEWQPRRVEDLEGRTVGVLGHGPDRCRGRPAGRALRHERHRHAAHGHRLRAVRDMDLRSARRAARSGRRSGARPAADRRHPPPDRCSPVGNAASRRPTGERRARRIGRRGGDDRRIANRSSRWRRAGRLRRPNRCPTTARCGTCPTSSSRRTTRGTRPSRPSE